MNEKKSNEERTVSSDDVHRLARQFVESDFYKLVYKPTLDAEIEMANIAMDKASDPWVRYGWVDYRKALLNITEGWLASWLTPPIKDKEKYSAPGYGSVVTE